MAYLNISYSENNVPRHFSSWVQIHQHEETGIASRVSELLIENDLQEALKVYNSHISKFLDLDDANPNMVFQ